MKKDLKFFLEANKLKIMPRTGWVLMELKNPETVAEHTFGVAFSAWILGEKKKLNIEKLIKIALCHDLCEVYAGDITPFLYYPRLPKKKKERKQVLMKWARLTTKEKEKIGKTKSKREKKSLLKLIKLLNPELRKEISYLRIAYEEGILREGKFVRQLNRIDTLLQSIFYFGTRDVTIRTNWWEWTEEIVDDPLLFEFLKVIQNRFYGKVPGYRKKLELENILDFILEVGKSKKMPRRMWRLLGVENPETVGSHIFTVALMAWIFGQKERGLNMEKLLKMALCHELSSIYTDDITPYDRILLKEKKKKKEIFKKWIRLSRKEKEKIFLQNYREEKVALKKLIQKLSPPLKKEIVQLFEEYKTASTAEARFLNQVNVLAVLLQALQYQRKDKDLPIEFLWEWAFEKCENSISLEFLEELKKKFYGGRFIYKVLYLLSSKIKSRKK